MMKKFVLSSLLSLSLALGLSGTAHANNSLDTLFTVPLKTGACGLPPVTKDTNFCKCFLDESTRVCLSTQPASICKRVHESFTHIAGNNYKSFCERYKNLMPKDASGKPVSTDECVQDLSYYNSYCK
jgi:hypothetical protein